MNSNYNFDKMVEEAYTYLDNQTKGVLLVLPTPVTEIEVTRLHWKNVKEYLKRINRNPDHFMDFLKKEFTNREVNWVSNSKSDGLFIHGKRLKHSNIVDISVKYVEMYNVCPNCKKSDSEMHKTSSKQYEFECLACGTKKFLS